LGHPVHVNLVTDLLGLVSASCSRERACDVTISILRHVQYVSKVCYNC